jgi:tRNA dimethylallyltransferase
MESTLNWLAPVFLAGPTAVGKSEIAIALAERLGAEIISVDSMQVYRGLDIGTAKPSAMERARVPHHLLDVVDLKEPFDAARFIQLAQEAVTGICARGKVPLFCGGTGLYFKAYLEGLSVTPPADAGLRESLRATPMADLLRELADRDPDMYSRIDRQNPRRVIRALEVIRLTGRPFSEQRARWTDQADAPTSPSGPFGLCRCPGELHTRIEARVDDMFHRGLVAETAQLLDQGLAGNPIALQALGYRQVVEHLQGARSLSQTIELVKIRTRQFARRQMTWFRRQMRLNWLQVEPASDSISVVEKLFEAIRSQQSLLPQS